MLDFYRFDTLGEVREITAQWLEEYNAYAGRGLLKPEHVDRFTGYRYYTLHQLPRAHRIMALKELGLSLDPIGAVLNEELTLQELRGMLRLKRAEIEQHIFQE